MRGSFRRYELAHREGNSMDYTLDAFGREPQRRDRCDGFGCKAMPVIEPENLAVTRGIFDITGLPDVLIDLRDEKEAIQRLMSTRVRGFGGLCSHAGQ